MKKTHKFLKIVFIAIHNIISKKRTISQLSPWFAKTSGKVAGIFTLRTAVKMYVKGHIEKKMMIYYKFIPLILINEESIG